MPITWFRVDPRPGGFYVISAEDLDGALSWASRVSAAINTPIEARPFAQTPA
jgi:hypothetical protein